MSKKYRDLVSQRSKAKSGSLFVLYVMASWAGDDTGICSTSIGKLVTETRMTDRGVQKAIGRLIADGEIEVVCSGHGRGNKPSWRLLHSDMTLIKGEKSSPFESGKDEQDSPLGQEKGEQSSESPEEKVNSETEKVNFEAQKGELCDNPSIYMIGIDQLDQGEGTRAHANESNPTLPEAQTLSLMDRWSKNKPSSQPVNGKVRMNDAQAAIVAATQPMSDPPSRVQLAQMLIQAAQFHAPEPPKPTVKRVNITSAHIDNSRFTEDGYIPAGTARNAVEIYYERFCALDDQQRLTRPQEDDLVGACTDLEKLRAVVIAYSRTSYKARNVGLILDWYRTGIPNQGAKNATATNFKPTPASTPAANERRALAPAARVGRNEAKLLFADHPIYKGGKIAPITQ